MVKSIKKWTKYLLYVIGALLLLLFILLLLVRTSWFQNFLADKAADYLSKELQSKVSIEAIDVRFFNMVSINGLYVEDLHADTLIYAKEVALTLSYFKTEPVYALVNKVYLENTTFKLQKYADEEQLNIQFLLNYFASSDTTQSPSNLKLNITALEFNNLNFSYQNHHAERKDYGVDYNHIHATNINLFANGISVNNDSINGYIHSLAFNEQSGFKLEKLTTKFSVSSTQLELLKMQLKTPTTSLNGVTKLKYHQYTDYKEFIEKVKMNFDFRKSEIDFQDIAFFAPQLRGLNKKASLEGKVYGYVNDLKGKKIKLETDDGTRLFGNVDLNGLPDINNTFAFIEFKELTTSKQQLETFPLYPFTRAENLKLPKELSGLGNITFKGDYTGFINDFVLYGKFYTDAGDLSTDISLKQDSNNVYGRYVGQLSSENLAVNKIIKNEYVGRTSFNLRVDGNGYNPTTMKAKIVGQINYIDLNKNRFEIITLDGKYNNKIFDGCISSRDSKLDFDFDGTINLRGEVPKYKFTSTIYDSKPAKLGLMERSGLKTRFSTNVYIDMEGTNIDNMIGTIKLEGADYKDIEDEFIIDTFIVHSYFLENKERHLEVSSDIADLNFIGNFKFNELDKTFKHFIGTYLPYFEEYRGEKFASENNFEFNAKLKDANLVSKLFTKDIFYPSGAEFNGSYNALNKSFKYSMDIPNVNAKGVVVNNFKLKSSTENSTMMVNVSSSKISLTDSLFYENFELNSSINRDSIYLFAHIHSKDTLQTVANIKYRGAFEPNRTIIGEFYSSEMFFNDEMWSVNLSNKIIIDSTSITIDNLEFATINSGIKLDGKASKNNYDLIELSFINYDLENFNKLLATSGVKLEGIISGNATMADVFGEQKISSDIEVSNFALNGAKLGNGKLLNKWNESNKSLHTDAVFKLDNLPTFNLSGDYNFNDKVNALNYILSVNNAPTKLFEFAIADYVSDLKGTLTGYARIKGGAKDPKITGKIDLEKLEVKIDYLNTVYKTSTSIFIDEDMFAINNAELVDEENNKASLNATIFHENFTDFNLDIGLYTKKFLFLNTTEFQNKLFYGKAILSGQANISGYADQLVMDAEVKTEKGSLLNIPLSDETEIGENNLVTFINTGTDVEEEEEIDLSHILMNFKMEVNPDAEVRLIFDEQIGDVIKSRGDGDILMEINTKGDFNIYGTYTISEGDYLFTLQNVINKRFALEKGGTISWNGDPLKAQLDINAIYRLRASPYDLMVGDSLSRAKYKNRIPIEVKLEMEKDLMNPDISFDIEAPSATQEVRDRLASITYASDNQSNANEMNKQVFALLILNRFIPPQGGNPDNAARSGFGSTTGFETISNQLSNWLSQITDKFDVGFNYRPGDAITSQEVEVALSTQIFNDRVVLDGNVGSVGNTSTQTNNLVGEFSVEYKITEDGKLRAKAFNEANTNVDVQTQGLYTQGVGLFYRQEFDKISDLWDKEKRAERKKQREERKKDKEENKKLQDD